MPKPIFPEDLGSPRTLRTILRESFEGRIVGIGVNIIRSFINLVIKFSHHSICRTKIYHLSRIVYRSTRGGLIFEARNNTRRNDTQRLRAQQYMYNSDNTRVARLAPGQIFAPFPDELAGRSVGRPTRSTTRQLLPLTFSMDTLGFRAGLTDNAGERLVEKDRHARGTVMENALHAGRNEIYPV